MATRISKTTAALGQLARAEQKRAQGTVLQRLGDPVGATFERMDAQKLEDAALEVLKPPQIAPTPTRSGDLAAYDYPDPADRHAGLHLLDSLTNPDMITAQASLERMLVGQLASVHYTALHLLAQSQAHAAKASGFESPWQREQNVEACRLVNASTRLMASFHEGVLALQKLRTGGKQTVVVQHVQVHDGGQAVIAGDLTTGGGGLAAMGGGLEKGETMPCEITSSTPGRPRAVGRRRAKKPRVAAQRSGTNGGVACMEA
jgi:hypothetical protein